MKQLPLLEKTDAQISSCGLYRYNLSRIWEPRLPLLLWVMLNPSTADQYKDDPTLRRCKDFARRWGFGGILVGNLFAFRATDHFVIRRAMDPIGPENDAALLEMVGRAEKIVVAWSSWGDYLGRDQAVLKLLEGRELWCLGLTYEGFPRHPLYVLKNTYLRPYTGRES